MPKGGCALWNMMRMIFYSMHQFRVYLTINFILTRPIYNNIISIKAKLIKEGLNYGKFNIG